MSGSRAELCDGGLSKIGLPIPVAVILTVCPPPLALCSFVAMVELWRDERELTKER
jgi:hypothetical protein